MSKVERICQICETIFYTTTYQISKGYGNYCSIQCHAKSRINNVNTKCSFCNKDISLKKSRITKHNFCNAECMKKFFVKENHMGWIGGEIKIKCLICNKEFTACNARVSNGNGRFCSQKCYGKWRKENIVGDKCSSWRGGTTAQSHIERTTVDYVEWRKKVFERDNYICKKCGISGSKSYLNAHHVIPFSVDKSLMYDVTNGITLCKKCHLLLHKKQKLEHKHQFDIFQIRKEIKCQ